MSADLRRQARAVLTASDVDEKLQLLERLRDASSIDADVDTDWVPEDCLLPGRPEKPFLVEPKFLAKRSLGKPEGRAALLHAVAHIEFNAINLACDAVQRYTGMPAEFYRDWVSVAVDEGRHFGLLQERLQALGHCYGDFDAHDGLWEMAGRTKHSCLERMALVPRLLEARGLDVTPGMIEKLRQAGDEESITILEVILSEEIRHVAIGSRWFAYCCKREGKDPEQAFVALLQDIGRGSLRGPFNRQARLDSGFSPFELEQISRLGGN
jgi:uncharacterized ferritin-like protein (DUF455 family)